METQDYLTPHLRRPVEEQELLTETGSVNNVQEWVNKVANAMVPDSEDLMSFSDSEDAEEKKETLVSLPGLGDKPFVSTNVATPNAGNTRVLAPAMSGNLSRPASSTTPLHPTSIQVSCNNNQSTNTHMVDLPEINIADRRKVVKQGGDLIVRQQEIARKMMENITRKRESQNSLTKTTSPLSNQTASTRNKGVRWSHVDVDLLEHTLADKKKMVEKQNKAKPFNENIMPSIKQAEAPRIQALQSTPMASTNNLSTTYTKTTPNVKSPKEKPASPGLSDQNLELLTKKCEKLELLRQTDHEQHIESINGLTRDLQVAEQKCEKLESWRAMDHEEHLAMVQELEHELKTARQRISDMQISQSKERKVIGKHTQEFGNMRKETKANKILIDRLQATNARLMKEAQRTLETTPKAEQEQHVMGDNKNSIAEFKSTTQSQAMVSANTLAEQNKVVQITHTKTIQPLKSHLSQQSEECEKPVSLQEDSLISHHPEETNELKYKDSMSAAGTKILEKRTLVQEKHEMERNDAESKNDLRACKSEHETMDLQGRVKKLETEYLTLKLRTNGMLEATAQIRVLEQKIADLELGRDSRDLLFHCGAVVRRGFLEQARESVLHADKMSLKQATIEIGNAAAHGGMGNADASLLLGHQLDASTQAEFSQVFLKLYHFRPAEYVLLPQKLKEFIDCEVTIKMLRPLSEGPDRPLLQFKQALENILIVREKYPKLKGTDFENDTDVERRLKLVKELTKQIVEYGRGSSRAATPSISQRGLSCDSDHQDSGSLFNA